MISPELYEEGTMKASTPRTAAIFAAAAAIVAAAGLHSLRAQQPAAAPAAPNVKRTVLLKKDLTAAGHEGVIASVEIPPGGAEGRHTHSADVLGYVQEGEVELYVEGQGTKTYKAGDTFSIMTGQIHEGTNRTSAPVKLLAVFVAEKGKPLTTQVK